MKTHKNTKQHTTIAAFLLFSIGLLFSSNTFAWTHQVGERYGGGIVFYVYDGGLHGLIDPDSNQGSSQWYNGIYKVTGATGDGVGAGAINTALIVAAQINDTPGGNFAAKVCADYSVKGADGVTYGDWYLPSASELILLFGMTGYNDFYWSSTEHDYETAWAMWTKPGIPQAGTKDLVHIVRCVRAF
jgi:hypothetical protein